MKKAVNPKNNCFVCMDMKLSNWELYISLQVLKIMVYFVIIGFPSASNNGVKPPPKPFAIKR